MPNPRGSYGEGEKFTQANRKDFGYGDLRDILAGVDTVTKKFSVDPEKIGLTGWSYGGFMTMFAVTQTNRFRAAVAGAGIANWQSYYGENSIDQWMIPFFGASVYDDPGSLRQELSHQFHQEASRRRRWSWSATATANARRRNPSNSGMHCATSMCQRSWSSIPTKVMASSIRITAAMCSRGHWPGSSSTCSRSRV